MPSGGKNQLFYKQSIFWIALNRVLTPAVPRSRRELSESSGIIEKGAFCVELWSFYCKKRISVPMSYITFFENVAGPRADEVDLEVYFGVVIGFTLCLPHICVRSTSSQPQVDFQVNLVGTGLCPYT